MDRKYKELSRRYHPDKHVKYSREKGISVEEAQVELTEKYEPIMKARIDLESDIRVLTRQSTIKRTRRMFWIYLRNLKFCVFVLGMENI